MAFLPGIFGRAAAPAPAPTSPTPTPAAPAQPATPVGGPATKQPAIANPGANPATMQNTPATEPAGGPQTGLDQFAALFTPKPVDPAAPKAPSINDPYLTALDPAAFKQQVSTANFAAAIPADVLQRATSGDVAALQQAINTAAQEAFSAATQLSHGLVEHGARSAAERTSGMIDSRVRNTLIRSQNTQIETLNHPSVSPVFNLVKTQMAAANPHLSAEQVTAQSEAYFQQFAQALTAPTQAQQAAAATPTAPDFSSYLK
jgi:hypothetical protein